MISKAPNQILESVRAIKNVSADNSSNNGSPKLYRHKNSYSLDTNPSRNYSFNVAGVLIFLILIFGLLMVSRAEAQQIISKPDSLKVYTHSKTISIEARKDIDNLELWDLTREKRRLKFKPKNQSIKVNTQRLRKSTYQIVLYFGEEKKLIKFKV